MEFTYEDWAEYWQGRADFWFDQWWNVGFAQNSDDMYWHLYRCARLIAACFRRFSIGSFSRLDTCDSLVNEYERIMVEYRPLDYL